jgi:hypothetical protein
MKFMRDQAIFSVSPDDAPGRRSAPDGRATDPEVARALARLCETAESTAVRRTIVHDEVFVVTPAERCFQRDADDAMHEAPRPWVEGPLGGGPTAEAIDRLSDAIEAELRRAELAPAPWDPSVIPSLALEAPTRSRHARLWRIGVCANVAFVALTLLASYFFDRTRPVRAASSPLAAAVAAPPTAVPGPRAAEPPAMPGPQAAPPAVPVLAVAPAAAPEPRAAHPVHHPVPLEEPLPVPPPPSRPPRPPRPAALAAPIPLTGPVLQEE